MQEKMNGTTVVKEEYTPPVVEILVFGEDDILVTSAGNGDVGQGRGRGGGCDGVPYHRNQRTFSSGRNSGC